MRSTSRRAAALVFLLVGVAAARVATLPKVTGYVRVVTTYDNNPFRFSGEDLVVFRRSEDPDRFPIQSADDLEVAVSAGLRYRYRAGRKPGFLRLRTKLYGYGSNPEKTYGWLKLEAGQDLWPGSRVQGALLWMPGFLIRHYQSHLGRDGVYLPCRFAEYLGTVKLRQRIGRAAIVLRYRHEWDDYVPGFDYYDTRAYRPGGKLEIEPVRGLHFDIDYEYKQAWAAGPVPDISYAQQSFAVGIRTGPRKLRDLTLGGGYWLDLRGYTTANSPEDDPSHAERSDVIEGFRLDVEYDLGGTRLVFGYRREWREAESPNSERIEDVKSYRRDRFSLGAVVGLTGSAGR